MPFHEIDRPSPDQIIEPPEVGGILLATIPSLRLYQNELAFWREVRQTADQQGNPGSRRMAEESSRVLRNVASERMILEVMLQSPAYDLKIAGELYANSLMTVAHSRLLREIISLETTDELGLGYNPKRIGMVADYSNNNHEDVCRSGVHVTPGYMRDALAIPVPTRGDTRYYEGEAIYLKATTPARPTSILAARFEQQYQEPFRPKGFVSIVGRLKADFWNTDHSTSASR